MPLGKNQPASAWIHDFVKSSNSRFKGKSRAQRIKMALGAYYGKQNEERAADELRIEAIVEGKVSAHVQYKSLANWQAATLGMGFKHHSEPHVVHGNKHYATDKTGNVRGNYSEKWKVGFLPKRIGEALEEANTLKKKTAPLSGDRKAKKGDVPCMWFAGCDHAATGTTPHSILGPVHTCNRCHKFATGEERK